MSKYFAESNSEQSKMLFNKRTVYKGRAMNSSQSKNIVDFNLAERRYFGKVDRHFTPVFISEQSFLKRLHPNQQGDNYMALNFVADLFNEMSKQFDRCVATGQIDADDPYLSSLKVYKAYESPVELYKEYKKVMFAEFKNSLNAAQKNIEDFDHFLKEFLAVIPRFVSDMPFTFPAFVKSRENPMTATGLTIELADLPYDNDEDKKEMFLKSKNWDFFVNACNKYGFLIDYNAPWRIVCDIKAEEIHPYISNYFFDANSMLDSDLSKASIAYLADFIDDLNIMYNTVAKKSFLKTKSCDGRIIKTRVKPPRYTRTELVNKYTPRFFVKLYLRLRLLEEQPNLSEFDVRRIIKDLVIYTDTWVGSWLTIQNNFEKYINKPFDKPYSFTYTFNVEAPAKERARIDRRAAERGYSAETTTSGQSGNSGY